MNHLRKLMRANTPRADNTLNIDDWMGFFNFGGLDYPISLLNQSFPGGKTQELLPTFSGLASGAMRSNGIVWSCVIARMLLFAEATFQFRPKGSTTDGDLYGKPQLQLLEEPWPGGNTRKLLSLMDLHAQLDGNAYAYRDPANPGTLRVARPDWMTIVLGSRNPRPDFQVWDIDTEIIGYIYRPWGKSAPVERSVPMLREQVAHFMPYPDPDWPFRGRSWLQPVVGEILGDSAATEHKLKFFENGATPNMVVTLDPSIRREEFERWVDLFNAGHKGTTNAYSTIFLAGGADAKVVGADLKQLDFRMVQAHGETRICNAARIPPIIVGVSEGLDSATYSNYGQAKRMWGDSHLRPLWAAIAAELAQLISVPADSELWYDARQIAFLAEDLKDQAEIQQVQAATLKSLIDAGWTPESSQAYLESNDLSKLTHTGLFSVQLQPPGTGTATTPALTNGTAPSPAQAPAALACSLCKSPAATMTVFNSRCPKCRQLNNALRTAPRATATKIADQLAIDPQTAAITLGVEQPPPREPRALELTEPSPDRLTPLPNGNGGRLT